MISPSPDCKILSIPYTRNASRPSPSVPSLSVASQRDRRAKKSTRASRAPLVPEMTSTSSPRSSPPRCSRAAPRFHERETFSLVPARLVPVSPRPVRASSSSSIDRARVDGSRVVVVVALVVARSSSSLASRSRAYLDDDERSPELIERETHRARPIVAISRARARRSSSVDIATFARGRTCRLLHRRYTNDTTYAHIVYEHYNKESRCGAPSP